MLCHDNEHWKVRSQQAREKFEDSDGGGGLRSSCNIDFSGNISNQKRNLSENIKKF